MSDSDAWSVCLEDQPHLDALMMIVGQGEASAFDQLYRQLAGPVYRTALSVLRNPAQAEEVAQEVLLEVWRMAGRFDPAKGTAAAWVLTMARRRAIDRVRSVVADAARDRHGSRIQTSWDQVSEAVQEILDRERLTYSLAQLTAAQRQVIMLAFYGGHTYTEVATILGIAVGTVKSRIRAALTRMRESMRSTRLAQDRSCLSCSTAQAGRETSRPACHGTGPARRQGLRSAFLSMARIWLMKLCSARAWPARWTAELWAGNWNRPTSGLRLAFHTALAGSIRPGDRLSAGSPFFLVTWVPVVERLTVGAPWSSRSRRPSGTATPGWPRPRVSTSPGSCGPRSAASSKRPGS